MPVDNDRRTIGHFKGFLKGCLLGGAVGDALGAPIEFISLAQIRSTYSDQGLTDYTPVYGRKGAVTDDTQMLLFTAEGLILSRVRHDYQEAEVATAVYHAYLRWLYTQDIHRQSQLIKDYGTCSIVDGILTGHRELFHNVHLVIAVYQLCGQVKWELLTIQSTTARGVVVLCESHPWVLFIRMRKKLSKWVVNVLLSRTVT